MPCVLHHAGVHTCRMYFIMQECTHAVYTHHAGVHACCMYFIMQECTHAICTSSCAV